jgi:hypothetical protein
MKLRLPARFEDMTLGMLQALETSSDMLTCLEAATGQPKEQLRQLPHNLLEEGYNHLLEVRAREVANHTPTFALDGVEYGFIPKWDEFTAGEYIDAEQYSADFWPNAHKLMSVLFRPIERTWGDSYTIAPYTAKEDAERLKMMSADKVLGALLFFCSTKRELLTTLQSSLIATGMGRTPSPRSGVGTRSSSRLRGSRILKWMRSQGHRWGIYSRTWRF